LSLTCAVSASDERNWVGEGGKGISITILAPQAAGLAENQNHLPALIQGEFVSNFSTYSAIDVLDWQRREAIIVHIMSSPSYSDSVQEQTRREIGNLIPTTHFMDGKLIKTAAGYNLQMSIIRNSDKMTTASYSGNFTFWDLNNLTGIRQASLELLQRMGVTLTAKAREELTGAAMASHVSAQTALARGVTAQRQGTEVAALSYYFQAAAFDPSLREAVNRSSILNANITGGSMGDNIRNEIAWRRQWIERLEETERFFDNFNKMESMPYTLFYSSEIEHGRINFQNETVSMSIQTYLYSSGVWVLSIEHAVRAVYDGLMATGRAGEWGLANWPQQGVTNLRPFARQSKNFSVVFELVNSQNKVIGRQTLQAGGFWQLNRSTGRPSIDISAPDRKTLNFPNVSANDITDNLIIRVVNVNGKDAEAAAIDGSLQMRTITRNEVVMNDRFRFSRGTIHGFAQRVNPAREFIIPVTIWGDPVVSIGTGAFKGIELTSITIPGSVKFIGSEAFSQAGEIEYIAIGANVSMAENSFQRVHTANNHQRAIDNSFKSYYDNYGKKAGGYISERGRWMSEAEARHEIERRRLLIERREREAREREVQREQERERQKIQREQELERREIQAKQEQQQREIEMKREQMRPTIKLGWRGMLGFLVTTGGSSSEWFDMVYPEYNDINETAQWSGGANLGAGLTLNLRISNVTLATELNYTLLGSNYWYGGRERNDVPNYVIAIKTNYQNINIPVLLRLGKREGGYLEAGYQFGFPVSSSVTVSSGDKFTYNKFENKKNFSEFRAEQDQGIILGGGAHIIDADGHKSNTLGLRFVYHLTKWDRAGTLKSPFVIGLTYSRDFY